MKLILVRGLPGSGKTTFAKNVKAASAEKIIHIEADDYFMKDGVYCFDPVKLKDSHAWTQAETLKALQAHTSVIVSNTFTMRWELEPYFALARQFMIQPLIIKCVGKWQNVHGVPEAAITHMQNRWEDIADELVNTINRS